MNMAEKTTRTMSGKRRLTSLTIWLVSLLLAATLAGCSSGGDDDDSGGSDSGDVAQPDNPGGDTDNPDDPGTGDPGTDDPGTDDPDSGGGTGGGGGSGDGGDTGGSNDPDQQSLIFTYPYNGQQDVTRGTQIVATFEGAVSGDTGEFVLVDTTGPNGAPAIEVVQDANQPNIYRITPVDGQGEPVELAPETTFEVRLGKRTLSRFTTRPPAGRPTEGAFEVVARTPGSPNPVTGATLPFTEFNTLRLRLSASVDPATVTRGDTFTFTDGAGNPVAGRLTALGRYITFDPAQNLEEGANYTVALTGGVTSAFGKTLEPFTDTIAPLDTGTETALNLVVEPDGEDAGSLPDNPLNGLATNVATIASQLIGVNEQFASNADKRGGVTTTLAEPGMPGFNGTVPGIINTGQKVQLERLSLQLSGAIDTPVISGPIDSTFINDVDVYLIPNQFTAEGTPQAVRLRFDLGIGTVVSEGDPVSSLANGVFNQTVMNIQAAGTAVPVEGGLAINTVGSFPIAVNRTGTATVDLELQLVLKFTGQMEVQPDVTPPFVTAQFPSACLYVFGTPGYAAGYQAQGAAPTTFPEAECRQLGATVNSFPNEASPYVVFSEPLEPATVNDQSVQLLRNGTRIDAALRVEGTSVVIDPMEPLEPDVGYTIRLDSGRLTDLAGNQLESYPDITFTTAPQIDAAGTPPLIGSIMPGLPCTLAGGNFMSGGDIAGHCVNDNPEDGTSVQYPVFGYPANLTVDIFLSRFAKTSSIVLADGCLVSGSGNTATMGTVAVQHMDGSGSCLGAVEGEIVVTNRGEGKTRGFSFRPTNGFEIGERYWIVVCGTTDGQCATAGQIEGVIGGAINTDPLNNAANAGIQGAGGPTLIMPFDAVAPTEDFYATQRTVPYTDTNGNGAVDAGERQQPANKVITSLGDVYLSLSRPVAIRDQTAACDAVASITFDDGTPVVGTIPGQCIPVTMLPGGLTMLTEINLGILGSTGPTILRYPYVDGQPQTGYIVEKCGGTFPDGGAFPSGEYHYAPCFVANLIQTVNAPDGTGAAVVNQQQINVQVFGPVTFEQNGRQVISVRNSNTFAVDAAVPATTNPGELHFQLAATPPHGGRAFPLR